MRNAKNGMKYLIILLIFFSSFCKDPSNKVSNIAVIMTEQLRVREQPNISANTLAFLAKDDLVQLIGKPTNSEIEAEINGKKIKAPWYPIRTLSGIDGWIFGGAVGTGFNFETTHIAMPKIGGIGYAMIRRYSDNKWDKNPTWSLPPWKEVEYIRSGISKIEPKLHSLISVITEEGRVPLYNVSILKVEENIEKDDSCDKDCPIWYGLTLAHKNLELWKELRGIVFSGTKMEREYASNALLIYPTITYARVLGRHLLFKQDLPENVDIDLVVLSIDMTGDLKPDLIRMEYYCYDPSNKQKETWNYTCDKTYLRRSDMSWSLYSETDLSNQ
ncbi:SH3 domain-containing protein [Leptospira stimsonii]|uniref:SH3b domain-containing protein n=1 Tax=Leptospira stimsonii TaxID=2202203 RepID=A0A8B3CMU0_9LEPT|nr:SH3 domain-containing protein [Leptospira stimsonii]RHX83374.1 hypothetical protein DLM78_22000 [Leptospira stimsonii]